MPSEFHCRADDDFTAWLEAANGSIVATAYDANAVLVIGYDGAQVRVLARRFERPLGIDVDGDRMALATRYDITLFTHDEVLARSYDPSALGRYDGLFLPRASFHIPELNVHEVSFGAEGVWFVNTRFSCLAMLSESQSFETRWRPDFVTELVPEDRCHLNGFAMRSGKPGLATAFAATDTAGGWRDGKRAGGVLIDVDSGEQIVGGLCMPHSPRLHKNAVWVLNSGAGELLTIDTSGRAETVCRLPGYTRGLVFVGDCALVGLSKVRERHIFGEFPLAERSAELACGIAVVDLKSGQQVGLLTMSGAVTEVFDVRFFRELTRVNLLRSDSEASRTAVTSGNVRYWLRPEDERHDQSR
jgi:uncharacterized protein (TIGR03032 family)